MLVSYFEAFVYSTPQRIPPTWPAPPGYFDPEIGKEAFGGALEQLQFVEDAGFDWISVSEHHYSSTTQTPTPIVLASYLAAELKKIKIAMFGPHMPLNNPVRVAEELSMLDNLSRGRLLVGLLRGTANEFQVYSVNPEETRGLTTEGMELVLKAWTEPQPFSWEGKHYQYRSVSVWPRPFQQPYPPTYILGNSRDSCEFAAKHRLGLGVSFGPFEVVSRSTTYYREQCAREGWEPAPEQIVYRGRVHVTDTDEEAEADLQLMRERQRGGGAFPMRPSVREVVTRLDPNPYHTGGASMPGRPDLSETPLTGMPLNFWGSPKTVVEQVKRCRDVVGSGAIDFFFQTGQRDLKKQWRSLELFGKEVLPRIKEL